MEQVSRRPTKSLKEQTNAYIISELLIPRASLNESFFSSPDCYLLVVYDFLSYLYHFQNYHIVYCTAINHVFPLCFLLLAGNGSIVPEGGSVVGGKCLGSGSLPAETVSLSLRVI